MQTPYVITGTYGDNCNKFVAGTQFTERVYGYENAKRTFEIHDPAYYKDLKLQMILSNGRAVDIDPNKVDETNNALVGVFVVIAIIMAVIIACCPLAISVMIIVGLIVWGLMFEFVSGLCGTTTAVVLSFIAFVILAYAIISVAVQ